MLVYLLEYYRTINNKHIAESICQGAAEVVSEEFIGKDKNVQMTTLACPDIEPAHGSLISRQTVPPTVNVCGTNCEPYFLPYSDHDIPFWGQLGTTNCFVPSGGGPDPNECHVIADALRYESQNTGEFLPP